jgi:PAS domain S-box-containing protein
VSVPLLRNGRFSASLYVNQREPRYWQAEDITLIEDVASRIWDAVERSRADEARRKSEERLTFALEAGGGVGTWDCDVPADRLSCNEKFARLFSVDPERAAAGAPIAEYLPAIHADDRAEVAQKVDASIATGGDYTAEYRVVLSNGSVRWLLARGRGQLDKSGSPSRFIGVVFDITDRKVVSLRDAFLVRLDDAVRPLTDAQVITQTAARMLGEHLDVNRCAYADVEEDEDTFNLTGDFNRGVPSIVGRYTFAGFGAECLRLMRKGEPYVVSDSETDDRTEQVRDSYRLTLIRSVICVSLLKEGRFVAAMAVHQTTPREWQQHEVEVVQQVASRCWESIERTRVARELQEHPADGLDSHA